MKLSDFLTFSLFGIKTILFKHRKPILGTIILTDDCNLHCKHCAVSHIRKSMYPYADILSEMQAFYEEGIRILFFCGGETMLWRDGDKTVRDLVKEAKAMGFLLVNVVTNGTLGIDVPGADVIFLSLDGNRESHNAIRGNTFDRILANAALASDANVCVYMAINRLNYRDIEAVCQLVREHPGLTSISFNFHTPYAGTEQLALCPEEKAAAVQTIKRMMKEGYPVFNLSSALDAFVSGEWDRPCYQCIISENKQRYVCGRCVEEEGLCEQCGYLFAVEFSLLFRGNVRVIYEMLRTYLKYV